jgi:phage protein D
VSGFKPEIDIQDWIIARAEYVIGDNGFTTKMEFEAKISDCIEEGLFLSMWSICGHF